MEKSKDKGENLSFERLLKDILEIDLDYYLRALVAVKEMQEAIEYFILDKHG